eukprot:SAG22_NODE_3392_length_1735_cov_1.455990_3_plen_125_part_00
MAGGGGGAEDQLVNEAPRFWQGLVWLLLVGAAHMLPGQLPASAAGYASAVLLPIPASAAVGLAASGITFLWVGGMPMLASLTTKPLRFMAGLAIEAGRALYHIRSTLVSSKAPPLCCASTVVLI